MTAEPNSCPFEALSLPGDGTPLRPSPRLREWQDQGPASLLRYEDGHHGLVVTGYDLGRAILEDRRFSMQPARMPSGPEQGLPGPVEDRSASPGGAEEREGPPAEPLDAAARRSQQASLLSLDGEEHARLRRALTSRFSVKNVRGRREQVRQTVASALAEFQGNGAPADLWRDYAQPIAARTHCHVLGVPDDHYERFVELFVGGGAAQAKYDFIRDVIRDRENDPGEDVTTDLLSSEVVTREEAEGLLFMLMSSGRDSVAYLITTASVALLTAPDQLQMVREDPACIAGAVEEFMRVGAMFLTLFPRTATVDVELEGVSIPAGTTVSVSSVAANRDPDRWDEPQTFDVERDAFGHLGFGHGIHGCIGQQLARVEIREAVTQLFTELPGLRLLEAEQLRPMPFAHPVATYEAGSALLTWE